MPSRLSRRDFLKLAGIGLTASAAGGAANRVERLASRSSSGLQVSYTVCGGCSAGCGVRMVWDGAEVVSIAGNPYHPQNKGLLCATGKEYLRHSLSTLTFPTPLRRIKRGTTSVECLNWGQAIAILRSALAGLDGDEMAFLTGAFPSSRLDFFRALAKRLGTNPPVVLDPQAIFHSASTMSDASHLVFGHASLPYYDLPEADLVLLVGVTGDEPWLGAGQRLASDGMSFWRGKIVHVGARRSPQVPETSPWIPLLPGCEPLFLKALALSLVDLRKGGGGASSPDEVHRLSAACGCDARVIRQLAQTVIEASAPLIVPGSMALATKHGAHVARQILALNGLLGNLGRRGGVHLPVLHTPLGLPPSRAASLAEINRLLTRMQDGRIKALFIYGADPLGEPFLRAEFETALQHVPLVISLSPAESPTSLYADYIFPDASPLLTWGYHHLPWSDRPLVGLLMPARLDGENQSTTARLFAQAMGEAPAGALGSQADLGFVRQGMMNTAFCGELGWQGGLERGGWWQAASLVMPPVMTADALSFLVGEETDDHVQALGESEFYLLPFRSNKANSLHTGSRSEMLQVCVIHPQTAQRLGITSGENVLVQSAQAEIRAVVRLNPHIHPRVIALPLYSNSPSEVSALLEKHTNQSGDFAWAEEKVLLRTIG